MDAQRAGSAERINGPAPPAEQQPRDQPAIQRSVEHSHASLNLTPNEVSPTQGERPGWAAGAINADVPTYPSASYPEGEPLHKRKRSDDSMDERREVPAQTERQQDEHHLERSQLSEPRERDPYGREQREREYQPYGDEHRERERDRESWYSPQESRDERHPYSQPASAAPDSARTEEQIGEALRRATEHDYAQTSPEGDDHSVTYSGPYTPEQRRDGVIQSHAKKRKRNFSNRTKTGCLTCRRRKKKCDESKPECECPSLTMQPRGDTDSTIGTNCLKGGFVCEGYPPQRGTWPKPENKVQTIQIESKDPTYKPPGAYGMPQAAMFPNQQQPPLGQQKREPLPSYRGQPLRIEPPVGRPLYTDDDRPTASTLPSASVASPDNKLSALSTAYANTPGNVFPTPVSAAPVPFPERGPKEYQRVPPLHDLTRTEPDMTPQSTTLPHINIMHATRTNSPISTPHSSTVQTTAQLALSHTSQFSSPVPAGGSSGGRRERDEMLAERQYYPFDKELVLERERCIAALYRFNNSINPTHGASPEERARLFRDILQPKAPILLSALQTIPVTRVGHLGDNVVVEAPFTCDYGYNIQIGKNTVIGRNCTVVDACEVIIGNNVVIGPNVSFYTTTMTTDPRRRNGAKGACQAQKIIVEDDVFIGGSVTVLGGVKIGRGTTVGAMSLVNKVCLLRIYPLTIDLDRAWLTFGRGSRTNRPSASAVATRLRS